MPTAIAFMISQVHDRGDRQRVERRRRELTQKYAAELGGLHTMGPSERVDVEVAGELAEHHHDAWRGRPIEEDCDH